MLAEPVGHDSKMEDACSQKVSCGDTLTSHFFQTEQSPFLMFFFPFLRALESSCLYFDPPVCLMKILCLALPAYISDHPSSFLASSLQASPPDPLPFSISPLHSCSAASIPHLGGERKFCPRSRLVG